MQEETTLFDSEHIGRKTSKGKKIAIVVLIIGVACLLSLIIAIAIISSRNKDKFHQKIMVESIMKHLKEFNNIADLSKNKNSRGVLEGYDDTVDYVVNILKEKADCEIEREYFNAPIFYEYGPSTLELKSPFEVKYQFGIDFQTLRYSGNNSEVTGTATFIPNGGCQLSDYDSFTGGICLIEYDGKDCDLIVKGLNCENSGGSAMIIFNKGENQRNLSWGRVRKVGYWDGDPLVNIPCLSATYSLGNTLRSLEDPVLHIVTNTSIIIARTSNIYCTTKDGDPHNTIIAGAHLDSVPAGPGINDNGSGSATLLEIIIQWYKAKVKPKNRVRFAFWGAEELGLIGSRYYVNNTRNTNPEEFNNITMALNFDMLGSPNYIAYINTVRNTNLPKEIVNGSEVITRSFETYFNESDIPYELSPMNGGSDYYSFAEAGIPAGGLLTGAGGIKTAKERTVHGGLANAAYDPCYHQHCDTIENINQKGLEIMSRGAAYAIYDFATRENLREELNKG